jgi:hypothetical protein
VTEAVPRPEEWLLVKRTYLLTERPLVACFEPRGGGGVQIDRPSFLSLAYPLAYNPRPSASSGVLWR